MCELCENKVMGDKVVNMAQRIDKFFCELAAEDEEAAKHAINVITMSIFEKQRDFLKHFLSTNNLNVTEH